MDGVEPEDERYPDAPVPRHERAWRHPSEIGEATWQRSEPPLAVGRGLLVTTGAIGGILALAVLWAMVPTGAGGRPNAVTTQAVVPTRAVSTVRSTGGPVGGAATLAATTHAPSTTAPTTTATPATTARPTATDHTTATGAEAPSTADSGDTADTAGSDAQPGTTDDASAPTSDPSSGTTTGPTAGSPSSMDSAPQATIRVTGGGDTSSTAIAVVVGGVPVVLTTASAVRDADETVTLAFDDGRTASATVALTVNGIALLTSTEAPAAAAFKIASTPHDGDTVTLLGATPATVALHVNSSGTLWLQSWSGTDVAEGTPVVDGQGRVVALCSKGTNGPKLVTIDQRTLRSALDSATAGSTATTRPSKPYLGVYLNADPQGSLTINAVDPNGPAAAAGIVAGDAVVAIDAAPLASSDDLFEVLAEHRPDDSVSVTVQHADGSQRTVDLVLATSPASA